MASIEEYAKQSVEQRMARLGRTADELSAAIKGQSPAALTKRPDEKNWAGVEVICHLRDTEEAFNGRFQMFLAMEESTLLPADPDRWAVDRQYLRCDAGEAIAAFGKRRAENLDVFRGLSPEQWKRGGTHPARGRMTFETFFSLMCYHDDVHLDQLKRALEGKA
ncbi:MAG: DinB family protein [Candidatus Rokubacteria bacterium]|nr:DinB family protein [Candidatus Rokubacteria bacterium]